MDVFITNAETIGIGDISFWKPISIVEWGVSPARFTFVIPGNHSGGLSLPAIGFYSTPVSLWNA